jgi:hypothetical protein
MTHRQFRRSIASFRHLRALQEEKQDKRERAERYWIVFGDRDAACYALEGRRLAAGRAPQGRLLSPTQVRNRCENCLVRGDDTC